MSLYVDHLAMWGWRMRGQEVANCHLFTDSGDIEELHAFAQRIGMRREWFQPHRIAPHYDLTAKRREKAVKLGAIEVRRHEASAIWRARREAVSVAAGEQPTASAHRGAADAERASAAPKLLLINARALREWRWLVATFGEPACGEALSLLKEGQRPYPVTIAAELGALIPAHVSAEPESADVKRPSEGDPKASKQQSLF